MSGAERFLNNRKMNQTNVTVKAVGDAPTLQSNERRLSQSVLLIRAFAIVARLYAYQFWIQGGRDYLNPDGYVYLAVARGEAVVRPHNTRLVVPFLASQVAGVLGLSTHTVFLIITPVCLFASLLLLAKLLAQRGVTPAYQAAVVLALGAALAVMFGHMPVLVDTPLLLLACLTIAALDRQKLLLALALVCVAALTKEYGVFLALPWAVEAYRKFGWRMAGGLLIPFALLAVTVALQPAQPRVTTGELFGYQQSLIAQFGLLAYGKTLIIWMWAALWPILGFLTFHVLSAARRRVTLTTDQLRYAAVLFSAPLLLLSDIDRVAMCIVPFACMAGATIGAFQEARFCALLACGGLATALARPLYTEVGVPRVFTLTMIAVCLAASTLLLARMLIHVRGRVPMFKPA